MATNPSIITRNVAELAEIAGGNTYEAVAIISKRARQIALKSKEELNNKLSDFASSVDNLEEIFENREQIEISKFYERLPKPTSLAIDEFIENKFTYTLPSDDKEND